MAQYTNTFTSQNGTVTNSVLDTASNTQTITVTAPDGKVATATVDPSDVNSNFDNIITNLARQLNEGGGDVGLRGIVQGVNATSESVNQQQQTATGVARVTNNPPPAVSQPIPAQTTADPEVPQPQNETANTAPNETTATAPAPVTNEDPETAAVLAAQQEADAVVAEQNQTVDDADPFEAARVRAEQDLNNQEPATYVPGDVSGDADTEAARADLINQIDAAQDANLAELLGGNRAAAAEGGITSEAAARTLARKQATLQSRYKQQGNSDWRVRLTLAQSADYLYASDDANILKPLQATQGVIFPYMPQITTNYQANYDQYDLIHSNYRGIFYKNSKVGDVQIRATFTAQDTKEAAYLLAVIHFFRSVTKMFYGQDAQRGTPPPLVYLYGLGQYQFNEHPCVVSTFNYTLPENVDYIRATAPNNYGSNLLPRRAGSQSAPGGTQFAGATRLLNALLPKGALPSFLQGDQVVQSVNNTELATYVPTKMEIDLTLIPVQTRNQVSKQFSLKQFARGDLIKGGFW